MFVLLDDLYAEGLLHVISLPKDYYEFDVTRYVLQGRVKRKTFKLSNKIKVLIARVNPDERQIDFALT